MKNFLAKVAKAYLITVGALATFFFVVLYLAVLKYSPEVKTPEPISEPAVVHLTLEGEVLENSETNSPFNTVLQHYLYDSERVFLPRLKKNLEKMASDPLVKGIFLEVKPMFGDLVAFEEMRKLLANFKEKSKKPIHAWFNIADTKHYYLASVADELIMPQESNLILMGPVFSLVYYGEALKKLGIGVDYVRQGIFKSAVEPFTKNEPSYKTKAMYESLEKDIRQRLIATIAKDRKSLSLSEVEKLFKHSYFNAKDAKLKKAITEVAYKSNALQSFSKKLKAKVYTDRDYFLASQDDNKVDESLGHNNGIAIIEARGTIKLFDMGDSEDSIVPEKINKELEWARKNDKVKAVVLRVSSPGGSPAASELIWEEVRKLSSAKPVVVSMGKYAASGGYYITTSATKIFASDYTMTGSIGVFHLIFDFEDFEDKYGVSFPIITQTNRKKWIGLGTKPSKKDRELLQEEANHVYQTFLKRVSEGRKLTISQVKSIAEGRVWTGAQAKDISLVDAVGGLKEAIVEAKKLAGFAKDLKVPVHRWEPPITNMKECLRDIKRCLYPKKMSIKLTNQSFDLSQLQPKHIKQELERNFGSGVQMLWTDYRSFD